MKIGVIFAALGLIAFRLPAMAEAESLITFHKDVLPILQKNCQGCHRPGQMAPMSFLSYEQTRPWAKAIKEAVSLRKMPPWFADPTHGHFTNDRSLRQGEIDTLTKWADSGAHEGNREDAPPVVQWPDGWVIQPDIIVPGSVFDVPAKTKNNVVEWMDVVVPSGGALIGAGAGAVAGTTTAFITGKKNVKLPVETPLIFSLRSSVQLRRS